MKHVMFRTFWVLTQIFGRDAVGIFQENDFQYLFISMFVFDLPFD